MIMIYVLDYGTNCANRTPLSAKAFGKFADVSWEQAVAFASNLGDTIMKAQGLRCSDPAAPHIGQRYLPIIVWYSDITPGRIAQISHFGHGTDGRFLISAQWGPGPSSESDYPPLPNRGLRPAGYTEDTDTGFEETNFTPPATPGDVDEKRSAWGTVLGAGALAAAGIGGYFLTRWAVNRKG